MVEIKKGLLLVKTTLKESFQEAIKKFLVHAFWWVLIVIALIAIYVLIPFVGAIMMYEVPIFWLVVVVTLSLIAIGVIHSTKNKKIKSVEEEKKGEITTLEEKIEEKTKQYSEVLDKFEAVEEKIQLWTNLEYKAKHNKGEEPKITVWQKFSNASDFEFVIKRIDSIAKLAGGPEIERFHYNESDNLFLDKQKLFFPEKIAPLDLEDKAIEYRINDITKLAKAFPDYKKRAFLIEFEQSIEFATQVTTTPKKVNKTVNKTVNIQPEDWKGGGQ